MCIVLDFDNLCFLLVLVLGSTQIALNAFVNYLSLFISPSQKPINPDPAVPKTVSLILWLEEELHSKLSSACFGNCKHPNVIVRSKTIKNKVVVV